MDPSLGTLTPELPLREATQGFHSTAFSPVPPLGKKKEEEEVNNDHLKVTIIVR